MKHERRLLRDVGSQSSLTFDAPSFNMAETLNMSRGRRVANGPAAGHLR